VDPVHASREVDEGAHSADLMLSHLIPEEGKQKSHQDEEDGDDDEVEISHCWMEVEVEAHGGYLRSGLIRNLMRNLEMACCLEGKIEKTLKGV
jgi:hypothetical protein